jgi:hypothetical protein
MAASHTLITTRAALTVADPSFLPTGGHLKSRSKSNFAMNVDAPIIGCGALGASTVITYSCMATSNNYVSARGGDVGFADIGASLGIVFFTAPWALDCDRAGKSAVGGARTRPVPPNNLKAVNLPAA